MNYIKSYCIINSERVILNGSTFCELSQSSMHNVFSEIYNRIGIDYRKFYKMDALSKLGFLASELLLDGFEKDIPKEDTGILLFNKSASLEADKTYQQTIQDKDNFFPSPSEFVYTLPNIVTGEIAIRNKIFGETMFYVLSDFQPDTICDIANDTINFNGLKYALVGWTEVLDNVFNCRMMLCSTDMFDLTLTEENLKKLFM